MCAKWILVLAAACLAAPALGQTSEEQGRERRRGPDGPGGPGRWGGPQRPAQMVEHLSGVLSQRLDLDEQQLVELDEIVAAFKESMELNADPEVGFDALREEMRAARESGDEDRMTELREQMRGQMRGIGETMRSLLDEIEPILREDQVPQLNEFRERMRDRMGGGDPRERMAQTVREMRQELDLDSEQEELYDQAVADLRERGEQARTRMHEMGSLWREMREARAAGDDERAAEIQAQIGEQRPDPQQIFGEFFDAVEALLTPEQMPVLAKYRESMREGSGGDRERDRDRQRVEDLFRAAQRLKLEEQQAGKLREIKARTGRASREIDRQDREAQRVLFENVKEEILKLLNDEQRQQFEQLIRSEDQSDRRDRGERGQRQEHAGSRPAGDQP